MILMPVILGVYMVEPQHQIPRGHHDMGGLPAGKVERSEHGYAEWELRVDALVMLMRKHRLTVDESRKNIEALPPEAYDRMGYYERWIASLAQTLLQRGIVTSDDIGRKMEEICSRNT
jgi:hypothetical protein